MEASNLTLTGSTQYDDLNGSNPSFGIIFDGLTVYPSPYIVLTEKQYTKHYYAGTERLATVIGGGGLGEIGNPVDRQHSQHDLDIISSFHSRYSDYDPFEHENNLSEPVGTVGIDGTTNPRLDYTCSSIVLTDLDVLTHQNILLEAIEQNAPTMTLEQNVYFYHGDHLGSANWITDADGKPIQYIHYAPYGELIANQQTIGYDERYKCGGDVNRGMLLSILGGKIGTARDVGNFAAGYLSGVHGIPLLFTRIAFDCLQKGIETPVSRSAQNIGYFTGYYKYLIQQNHDTK